MNSSKMGRKYGDRNYNFQPYRFPNEQHQIKVIHNVSATILDTPDFEHREHSEPKTEYHVSLQTLTPDSASTNACISRISGYETLPTSLRLLTLEEFNDLDSKTTRKIDFRILPMITLIYILNFLDRTNIGTARLAGLQEDLGLSSTQFQTVISVLYIGYILMQIPANILLHKFGKPAIFIPTVMFLWGIVSACCGTVQTYGQLIAVRFLLGWMEAGFFCSCLFYLSCWYTRKELTFRNAILFSGSLLAGAFAGLIGVAIINNMDNVRHIRAWRWLFIIEGSATCAIVPLAYFILPNMPHNSSFLSEQERDLVMWKLKMEVGNTESDAGAISAKLTIFLTIKDIKVWLIVGIVSLTICCISGVSNFFPSIIQTLGYTRMQTLYLTCPPYFIAVFFCLICSYHADKTGERFWHITTAFSVAIVAFIIVITCSNIGAKYFGFCIMISGMYCGYVTAVSWLSNIVPRPQMKRAIAIAIMVGLSNSTSIWNSYLFNSADAPRYLIAFSCNIGFMAAAIILCVILRVVLVKLNKRIENGTMDWERELGNQNDGSDVSSEFRFTL